MMEEQTQNAQPAGDGAFLALGLDAARVAAVSSLGYEEPTDIQREAIPPLIAGNDVLGQAATGTGKTAAFALPMLHKIGPSSDDERVVRGLILVPTRELAMQVAEAIHKYAKGSGAGVVPIYGGAPRRCTGMGVSSACRCCRSMAANRCNNSCAR